MQEHRESDLRLGAREITAGEQCIDRQRQLISALAEHGQSTVRAEALLATMESSLRQIRRLVRADI
jgi:hypothetical protein